MTDGFKTTRKCVSQHIAVPVRAQPGYVLAASSVPAAYKAAHAEEEATATATAAEILQAADADGDGIPDVIGYDTTGEYARVALPRLLALTLRRDIACSYSHMCGT